MNDGVLLASTHWDGVDYNSSETVRDRPSLRVQFVPPPSTLVLAYDMETLTSDGRMQDRSGNGNYGTMAGTATGTAAPWKATGPLTIGRSRWNDRATDFWAGDIADVQVWNRVLFDDEITEMTDPLRVGGVGEWHMDSIGPGPDFDSSCYFHDLTFFGGA